MASRTKTVCIIGAGPSGLVAAKALTSLPTSSPAIQFHVTLFEKTTRIGGLWPVSPSQATSEDSRLVNPSMRTNQSRHTVSFSDLAWPGAENGVEKHAQFPRAWEVGQYLERYLEKYGSEWEVRLGCKVVKAEPEGDGWNVHVHVSDPQQEDEVEPGEMVVEVHEFDHVIIASGFFGAPKIPSALTLEDVGDVPVWHSSRFRDVRSLITDGGKLKVESKGIGEEKRKIVVVGGQMSGVEVAANIAMQLSDCINAPEKEVMTWEQWEVVHVVQKPVWVMPLFLPRNPQLERVENDEKINNPAPDFLPCDLVSYNLAYKPPGELQNTGGHITVEAAEATHGFLNTYFGSDQSELGHQELAMKGPLRSKPPFLAVSDEYTEFVRSGNIKIIAGHAKDFSRLSERTITLESSMDTSTAGQFQISNVAAVILATGFDAAPSLNFLPAELLSTLQFDPTCSEFPLALNVNTVVSRSLPSLGFVGFYRSPYWGVMEMQARYLAKLWSGDAAASKALAEDNTIDTMLKLRRDPRQGQFPMGDYAYLMESFSKILDIKRVEPDAEKDTRSGLVFPPRYTYSDASDAEKSETNAALTVFNKTFSDSEKSGKFLARAVFRAMQGDWKLERQIESFISTYPSGKLSGTAKFLPRRPTEEGYDAEYLYVESGEFETSTGMKFTAKRRYQPLTLLLVLMDQANLSSYAHRYTSSTDKLSAWFIKPDDKTVDYFFHELDFIVPEGSEMREARDLTSGWKAKSSHFCTPDTYDVQYEFKFQGVQLKEWIMAYTVKGPQKDYKLRSVYRR
ncbi:Flavin-monooxygenase glucosinolate S-oxygenase 3 [Hyphodiscus hymeniophilus]|uniref:Flavin-monooxygenase glucosinolate S-oxygenase 3 n=1 Tax=Hyphodiscus hymeniophilus TaxID=353542 RepID=A0A9P6VNJ4_9HELO|nr:Flavin-monooxygenase glucosinolate S-oxygenase 3 [Hyphodiscus hymeniophilus]